MNFRTSARLARAEAGGYTGAMEGDSLPGRPRAGSGSRLVEAAAGLMVAACGLLLVVGVRFFEPQAGNLSRDMAAWMAGGGWLSLAIGPVVFAHAVWGWRRRTRTLRGGTGAWRADYDWPQDGLTRANTAAETAQGALMLGLSVTPGLTLSGMWLMMSGETPLMPAAGLLITAVWTLLVWHQWGTGLMQRLRHGESRLRLPPAPVYAGETVLAELETTADLRAPEVTLRCVREVRTGSGDSQRVERRLAAVGRTSLSAQTTAGWQLTLEAPADAPATALSADPPSYWELEVKDVAARYEAVFLVPVYPRPPLLP